MSSNALEQISFTKARANLSEVFDGVIHQIRPVVISRKREKAVLLESRTLSRLLDTYPIEGELYRDDDGSFVVSLTTFDIIESGPTEAAAIQSVIDELRVYSQDYMARLPIFLNAPNRKGHYPFVLRILLAGNDQEIKDMLKLSHA